MNEGLAIKGKTKEELVELVRQSRAALEIERHYRATLDAMMEGFQMIGYDWRYLYVNETVARHGQTTREGLVGFTMMDKYPGIEHTPMFKRLEQCMTERVSARFENRFDFPNGSKGWFDLSVQPIPEGLFILSMDITERKKAEAYRDQHIKELSELLYKISQQVRVPVNRLVGVSKHLDGALSREDVETVKESTVLLDGYTQDITDFVFRMRALADAERFTVT